MVIRKRFLLIAVLIIFFILPSQNQFSQSVITDTLKIGSTYNVILFNLEEYHGKLLDVDTVYFSLLDEDKLVRIPKNKILRITSSPQKHDYKYMVNVYGGYSTAPAGNYSHTSGSNTSFSGFNGGIDVISSFINSSNRNQFFRISLSFSRLYKPEHTDEMMLAIYPPVYNKEDESQINMYIFRTDYLMGNIFQADKFIYFFSAGFGFCRYNESSYKTYFFQNDTLRSTTGVSAENVFALVLSFGVSGGYRLNESFGLQAQIEYNLFASEKIRERIRVGYIPFKIGMFYYF